MTRVYCSIGDPLLWSLRLSWSKVGSVGVHTSASAIAKLKASHFYIPQIGAPLAHMHVLIYVRINMLQFFPHSPATRYTIYKECSLPDFMSNVSCD